MPTTETTSDHLRLDATSTLAALVDTFRAPPDPRESYHLTLVWRNGNAICAERIDAYEFLYGDRYAGWIRDWEPVSQLLACAGFIPTEIPLSDEWTLIGAESKWPENKSYVVGFVCGDEWELFGTQDKQIANAILGILATRAKAAWDEAASAQVEPVTPVPPPSPAGWPLSSLMAMTPN